MTKLMTAAALAASLFSTGAASAQPAAAGADRDTYSVAVRHADLNLASPSGLATFRGRVRAAAGQACGDPKVTPVLEATQIARCRAGFVRAAENGVTLALARSDTAVAGTR